MSHPAAAQSMSPSCPEHPVRYFNYENADYTIIHPSDVDFLPAIPNAEPYYNLSGRELRRPIWLVDNCPELAYMLKRYDQESAFMASVDINPRNTAIFRQDNAYVLDPQIVSRWQRLENALLFVCKHLLDAVAIPSEYCFGLASYWPTPTECGYKAMWKWEKGARDAARRSLDALRALIARCSMAIALATPDPTANPPRWVEILLRQDIDAKWLEVFRQSPIGDLSPGLRVGAYFNPSLDDKGTKWINHITCLIRAGVPTHIYWPHVKDDHAAILGRYPFLRKYYPVSEKVYKVPTRPNEEFQPVFRWNRVVPPLSTTSAPDVPAEIPHGHGQLSGESAEAFFARRDAEDLVREAQEKPDERVSRLARAKAAESFNRPSRKRQNVYLWSTIGDVFGSAPDIRVEWLDLDYREYLGHARARDAWQLYPDEHKRYNAFRDQWDICAKLVPTIQPQDVHEHDYRDDYDDDDDYAFAPSCDSMLVQQPEVLSSTTMAASFRTDLETLYEEHDAAYVPFVEDLPAVARNRFGLSIGRVEDLDIDVPFNRYTAADVVKLLGYLDSDLPDRVHLVRPLSGLIASLERNEENPAAPGAIWDLADTNPQYLHRNLRPWMKVVQVVLNRTTWYRIQYDVEGEDECWWELVVQSAAAVLELCRRQDVNTARHAADYLVLRGMPFQTIYVTPFFKPSRARISLGYRRPTDKFDYDDYRAYEYRLRSFLSRPKIRAALLQGGIVWRIALEVLPGDWIEAAAQGPSIEATDSAAIFRPPRGDDYIDDGLTPEELDFMCGVYRVYNDDYTKTAEVSWWPRPHIWKGSHYDSGHWTPWCEKWFLRRLGHIKQGTADMHTTTRWKSALRRKPDPGKFNKALELSAVQFLNNRMKIPLVDISDR